MGKFDREKHWEDIYKTKQPEEVSWYQPNPESSLYFIKKFQLPKTAKIIDVGGGDSFFADKLLDLGYKDITVLDISQTSIERAKLRLGKLATQVKWIVADASEFVPTEKYDFWHDRAAFHFLTESSEISNYINALSKGINTNGILIIGTFSTNGPGKCSGIDIKQYSQESMAKELEPEFTNIECKIVDHTTPSGSVQNFIFCMFRKKN